MKKLTDNGTVCSHPQTAVERLHGLLIDRIDPTIVEAVIKAHYEVIRDLVCGEEVCEWHCISKRYYKGKGWANIARTILEAEYVAKIRKYPTKDQIDDKARKIKYCVDTYRKKLGLNDD